MLLALLGALGVPGCGGDGNDDQGSAPPQSAQKRTEDSARTRDDPGRQPAASRQTRRGDTKPRRKDRKARSRKRRVRRQRPRARRSPRPDRPRERTSPPQEPSPSLTGPEASARVERLLRERYGGGAGEKASWYDNIRGVSVSNSTTTITTDLDDDAEGRRLAEQICTAVIGSIPGATDIVRVTASSKEITLKKCVP
jgi:hypothetical protein